MALPAGPGLVPPLQTLRWVRDPYPFLDECRAAYGGTFTLRLAGFGESVFTDDPATIHEFLLDFRASAATIGAELSAACATGQAARAGALAHKLKSSARSVGALALGELCAEMESAGNDGQIAALSRVWPRFEAEMAAVDAALADLTAHE